MDPLTIFCISACIMLIGGLFHGIVFQGEKMLVSNRVYKYLVLTIMGQFIFAVTYFLFQFSLVVAILITALGMRVFPPIFNLMIFPAGAVEKAINEIEAESPQFKISKYIFVVVVIVYGVIRLYVRNYM